MKKTYSVREAAKRIGVSHITLKRWLAGGRIRPSVAIPMDGRTFWRFTIRDVARFRRFGATLRPGPKAKRKK
jgi:excisionase family DNA binding protein